MGPHIDMFVSRADLNPYGILYCRNFMRVNDLTIKITITLGRNLQIISNY